MHDTLSMMSLNTGMARCVSEYPSEDNGDVLDIEWWPMSLRALANTVKRFQRRCYSLGNGVGRFASTLMAAEVDGHPGAPTEASSSSSTFRELLVAAMESARSSVRLIPAMSKEVIKGPTNTRSTETFRRQIGKILKGPSVNLCATD